MLAGLPLQFLSAQSVDIKTSAEQDFFRSDPIPKEIRSERNRVWEEVSLSLLVREVETEANTAGLESFSLNISNNAINIIYRDIRFLPNSSELTPETIEKIKNLTNVLSRFSQMNLLIQGHTAKLSPNDTNDGMELSRERARSVADVIAQSGIFQSEQIEAVGKGFYEPVAENETSEGRALNRRVEISVVGSVEQESSNSTIWWNMLSDSMNPGYTAYLVHKDNLDDVEAKLEEAGIAGLIVAETSDGIGILDNTITYREDGSPDEQSIERMKKIASLFPSSQNNIKARIGGYGSDLSTEEIEERHFLTAYSLNTVAGFEQDNIIFSSEPYVLAEASTELAAGQVTTVKGEPVNIQGSGSSFSAVVPFSVDSLILDITPEDSSAEITGLPQGPVELTPGENKISITVKSLAGSQTLTGDYSLTVLREEAELQSLAVSANGTPLQVVPNFSAETKHYQIDVLSEIIDVEVTPGLLAEDERAGAVTNIRKDYEKELNIGENTIHVSLSDGYTEDEIYTISVIREAPTLTTLDKLTVQSGDEGMELIPPFSPETTLYKVIVPYSVKSVSLNTILSDERALLHTENGEIPLAVGKNEISAEVSERRGYSSTRYIVVIERSTPLLSKLEIAETDKTEDITLVPDFKPDISEYAITVPYKTKTLQLEAALSNEDISAGASAQILPDGIEELPIGTTQTIVRVTDEEGTTYDYLVNIIREEKKELTFSLGEISLLPEWYVTPSLSFYTGGIGFKLNGGMTVRPTEDSEINDMLKPLRAGVGVHFHAGAGNYLTILSGGGYLSFEYILKTESFLPVQWYIPKTIIPRLETGFAYYMIDYTKGVYHKGAAFYLSPAVRTDFVFSGLPDMTFGLDLSYTAYISSVSITYLSLGINVGW